MSIFPATLPEAKYICQACNQTLNSRADWEEHVDKSRYFIWKKNRELGDNFSQYIGRTVRFTGKVFENSFDYTRTIIGVRFRRQICVTSFFTPVLFIFDQPFLFTNSDDVGHIEYELSEQLVTDNDFVIEQDIIKTSYNLFVVPADTRKKFEHIFKEETSCNSFFKEIAIPARSRVII